MICRVVPACFRTLAVALCLIASGGAAYAADTTPVVPLAQEAVACPEIQANVAAELRSLRETLLTPGAKINLAEVEASPALRAARAAEEDRKSSDWAFLCRYRADNEVVRGYGRPDVVFIGASITENWIDADPGLFSTTKINRGIGGQTTAQLLLRFYPDVVALQPHVVHIMGGANDVAGRLTDEDYKNNIRAMVDIAAANGIQVVLGSIPPTSHMPWRPNLRPAERIITINHWLRDYAVQRGLVYADYHSQLADAAGGLPLALGADGVHPNRDGYEVMHAVAQEATSRALANAGP